MKAKLIAILMIAALCVAALPLVAQAGELDDFVRNISLEARADSDGFKYRLGTEFNVGGATVDLVLTNVEDPGDAWMILKLGEVTGRSIDEVLDVYKANRNKGWGYIAKQLGIKPGSPEFHALKERGGSGSSSTSSTGGKGGKGKHGK